MLCFNTEKVISDLKHKIFNQRLTEIIILP